MSASAGASGPGAEAAFAAWGQRHIVIGGGCREAGASGSNTDLYLTQWPSPLARVGMLRRILHSCSLCAMSAAQGKGRRGRAMLRPCLALAIASLSPMAQAARAARALARMAQRDLPHWAEAAEAAGPLKRLKTAADNRDLRLAVQAAAGVWDVCSMRHAGTGSFGDVFIVEIPAAPEQWCIEGPRFELAAKQMLTSTPLQRTVAVESLRRRSA